MINNIKIKYKNNWCKIITLVVIVTFLCQNTTLAEVKYSYLAPPSFTKDPKIKREIYIALLRTRVLYAESEDAKNLLKAKNANALLLSSGKYLVTKEIAQDDLSLLRAILHEDIEALMQIMAEENIYKYQGIKELILPWKRVLEAYYDLFPPNKKPDLPSDLLLNDIIAKAIELIFSLEEEMISENELLPQEIVFVQTIGPIIMSNKHNYFTVEFWDSRIRGERIMGALNKGFRFYQVAMSQQNSLRISLDQYKQMVDNFMRENEDFESIADKRTFEGLCSPNAETRKRSFGILCESSDEKLAPLLINGLVLDLDNSDTDILFDSFTGKVNLLCGVYTTSLTTATKINIVCAFMAELKRNNPIVANSIVEDLKSLDADMRRSAVEKLRYLQNMGIFQPLIDCLDDARPTTYRTVGQELQNFFKELFSTVRWISHNNIEELLKQQPKVWQPDKGTPTWDRDAYTWYDEDDVGGPYYCNKLKHEAREYLISVYQITPYLNREQIERLDGNLEILMQSAKDFKVYYGGAHRYEDWYDEYSYVDIRDLIKKVRNRLIYLPTEKERQEGKKDKLLLLKDCLKTKIPKQKLDLLYGNKAIRLAEMLQIGLPIPNGFVITSDANDQEILDSIDVMIAYLEKEQGKRLGDKNSPLKLAVRSSPAYSMPGLLLTKTDVSTREELIEAIREVRNSWNTESVQNFRRLNGILDDKGTAVIIQPMVYGDISDNSASGVLFIRNVITGENRLAGRFAICATGKHIVSRNKHAPIQPIENLEKEFPDVYIELQRIKTILEKRYKNVQEVEFVIQEDRLWILQIRDAVLSPQAQVKIAIDMADEGIIDQLVMLAHIEKAHVDKSAKKLYRIREDARLTRIGQGIPSSPGAAHGHIIFSIEKAKELKSQNKVPILAISKRPEDIEQAILSGEVGGILTQYGHEALHESVLARSQGIPLIDAVENVEFQENAVTINDYKFKEGAEMVMDGSTGSIYIADEPNPLIEDRTVSILGIDFDYALEQRKIRDRYAYDSYEELVLEHNRLIVSLKGRKRVAMEDIYNNLIAHVMHQLLYEKGKELGKTEIEVDKELAEKASSGTKLSKGSPANVFTALCMHVELTDVKAIASLLDRAESTIERDLHELAKLGLARKIGRGKDAKYQIVSMTNIEIKMIQDILDKEYRVVTKANFNRVFIRVVVTRLLSTIRAKAQICKDIDEELVLAIDTDIGNLAMFAQELFTALGQLQNALAREGLDNVRIFIGDGKEIEAQLGKYLVEKGDEKDYVISAVVKNRNIVENGLFKEIKDRMQITAVDDTNIENTDTGKLNYIPILSILELSIKKAMGTLTNEIRDEYSNLPNIKEILEQNGMLIIYLLPKANPIPINELKERYKYEAQVLTSA